ncbi:hypothetical protein [Planktothrix paucivesiculata]|uniref:Uncharacterized protein n=1 Tax=Planktothrix paucivesiculata PCC 9631 TaxID=671071 RepID=A0A7Z9DYZ4_9CYAN|nr:hypothetical protein [Planktothrix paucivesiculata]VXD16779.1 hypothetical protein PL9631_250059 [Planktothrix paucivesiculata PCC 9631]
MNAKSLSKIEIAEIRSKFEDSSEIIEEYSEALSAIDVVESFQGDIVAAAEEIAEQIGLDTESLLAWLDEKCRELIFVNPYGKCLVPFIFQWSVKQVLVQFHMEDSSADLVSGLLAICVAVELDKYSNLYTAESYGLVKQTIE